jgi:twitching motility protein PilT
MALQFFKSDVGECLKRLAKGEFSSSEERDELLEVVRQADNVKPRDVVWMAFRPDRALREASFELLKAHRDTATVDRFIVEAKDKTEAPLRAGASILFSLRIPGIETHLSGLVASEHEATREASRRLVANAPPNAGLTPLLWRMAEQGLDTAERLLFLRQLAAAEMSPQSMLRWKRFAGDSDPDIRATALKVLADKAPEEAADEIVDQLACVDYGTQQHLIAALTKVAQARGVKFIDRLLPLMASGEAGIRSAVVKILLEMDDRHELVKRYLRFSKTLAGWARDRALDSMKEFGEDLVEPTVELLSDDDEEVRALALVVAGSFDDPRIIPATIELLSDEDWWLRVCAADTLGRFDDPAAVDALVAALDDPETRWAAVEALGRIGDGRALVPLSKLLNDPAPEIRIEVLLALRNFDHPKILEALHRVAKSDPHRNVRTRALELAEEVARRNDAPVDDVEALRAEARKAHSGAGEPMLNKLLVATRNEGGSDFHLSVDCPPAVRLGGELAMAREDAFSAEQVTGMIREILSDEQWERLERDQQLDFCHYIPNAGRYRANVFLDHKGYSGVFRVIPEQPPTIDEIGLPGHLTGIASYHQGLVLVCGPSGCGKSTTLAALVNLLNETRQHHIITLEDPVEFVHPFKNCLINQREIGSDTRSFARALRAALRENPDVIVIGDLRDNETVSLALTAAETGHIVLGTLSSTTAPKAVDRMITSFPHDEQPQVRAALAESLKFVIAQRLLPVDGTRKRVACFEVLVGTMSVANMIIDDKTYQLPSAMQIGKAQGMQTFDDSLRDLVRCQRITPECAYLHATKREEFEDMVSTEFLESRTLI